MIEAPWPIRVHGAPHPLRHWIEVGCDLCPNFLTGGNTINAAIIRGLKHVGSHHPEALRKEPDSLF